MLGKPVPEFSVPSTGGSTFHLSAFRGKTLALYFYPKDNTPGCTAEGADFVSRDSLQSHERFKEKMKFPFELLADPEEAVCRQFGVMKQKSMYGKQVRGIPRGWRGVKVPGHAQEVLNFVKAL